MSRRHIAYAVLVVASFVVTGCFAPTAPVAEDTTCRKGFVITGGYSCEP